jgi:hypothetical protein
VRNKTHLVAQDFSHMEALDFGKTFNHAARFEAIMILLVFTASKEFKLYQMNLKSALLNDVIQEEVYVRQSLDFENSKVS